MLEISRITELLFASQEGFCSVYLINWVVRQSVSLVSANFTISAPRISEQLNQQFM
jgi:hypothetical protein